MSNYEELKKIIPPDQALANEALSRSLRQVKQIFDADLPAVAAVVSKLESNKDLPLINALPRPLPQAVTNYWSNTFSTGTGTGNSLTTYDFIGVAAGNTTVTAIPDQVSAINQLDSFGALDPLTGNGGSSGSVLNGVYTVMTYCLAGAYTTDDGMGNYTVTVPLNNYISGTPVIYVSANTPVPAIDQAFATTLIPNANVWITNIAASYGNIAQQSNDAGNAMAQQLVINVENLTAAEIDVGNLVLDPANANLVANSTSSALGLASQLHDLGLGIQQGGTAEFMAAVANTASIAGQAVVAGLREGRNRALLQSAGLATDSQIPDINPSPQVANNLGAAQYTVAQALANIVI